MSEKFESPYKPQTIEGTNVVHRCRTIRTKCSQCRERFECTLYEKGTSILSCMNCLLKPDQGWRNILTEDD